MIRVLLADDQALIRAGFAALVAAEPDMAVVGEAATGRDAAAIARRERPDVVLMDIRMPGGDGIEATRAITASPGLAACRVVVVTTFELDEYVAEAVRAGASGFLVKDTEPAELLRAIRVVAAGDALLSPGPTRLLLERVAGGLRRTERPERLDVLTDREREVMALVAAGLTNDEIAARLFLSPLTAKTHVSRVIGKVGARDRVHLVVLAYETGLIAPGWQPQAAGSRRDASRRRTRAPPRRTTVVSRPGSGPRIPWRSSCCTHSPPSGRGSTAPASAFPSSCSSRCSGSS